MNTRKCRKRYMSRFIETIQVFQGELKNLEFHQDRFERTRSEALHLKKHPSLDNEITLPKGLEPERIRCRVTYGKDIELIEFEPYHVRRVQSLKLVFPEAIAYAFKYADRSVLDELFQRRGACDDILIVKNNCLTDSYYANVILWDGSCWETPDTPLLCGTMRASLLQKGLIRAGRITLADLHKYQKIKLINAMNDLEDAQEIRMDSIL